ncbi:MAG: nucleoside triphosphate pyrophosphohydrolase [Anderseniella sp.]|jgi:ATP diphosphatase|nr:nucleoside triphosphate pyrophosphohydrolase [Anderseniella sp.]
MTADTTQMPKRDIATLLAIMAALRTPGTGCPWDLEQDFASIVPYTLEEAYEVADAIERGNMNDLCEELGDLLLQVVYHAQMAREAGDFSFDDVVEAINTKMIRRHPHVFGDEAARSAGIAKGFWERIKAEEREGTDKQHVRHLDGIPAALPALTRALKLQKRAAKVGFDWPDISHVLDKVVEEARELAEARQSMPRDKQAEEFGDLLFVMVNLGRHLGLDAEDSLRHANAKFTRRFNYVEEQLEVHGSNLDEATLDQMDTIWDEIRARDKQAG